MAEDSELEEEPPEREQPGIESSAALDFAHGAASRKAADAFLNEQTAMLRVQREHLHAQRDLQISHLKWRQFNDWARAGWQVILGAIGIVIVIAIGTALWDASRAEGLVVDAFTVPQDYQQRGLSGDVVADDIVERLSAIRRTAMIDSYSITNDVSSDCANEIKVDIPETGISVSDAWRYLRRWLGHERHLAGNLRKLDDGRISLSLSLNGADAVAAAGKPSDLPALEQKAAEDVFGAFDPVNHINYLTSQNRRREAMESAEQFVHSSQGPLHADAYTLWAYTTVYATGDVGLGLARARIAMTIYPLLAVAHVMAARLVALTNATYAVPLRAVAQAHAGRFAEAEAAINATPRSCDACATAHGDVEAVQKHWAAAAVWFAGAIKLAPSVPFADADWGAMLLHEGDYDGAIAKLSAAHEKGPRFADPLEMWGEALMQENHSDFALAKFEEANKYAPNWGRLHLKWGESLIWSGDKAGARKQFDIASGLDLAPRERSELLRMRGTHG